MFAKGKIEINIEWCKGCELCVNVCPNDVIEMSEQINKKGFRYPIIKNAGKCNGCGLCYIVCPEIVISVYKRKKII